MDLIPPRPKRMCRLPKPKPLPLMEAHPDEIKYIHGVFDGFSVVIQDFSDMKNIVSMGYFGKANLSRSYPVFDGSLERPEIIRKRQFLKRKEWNEKFKLNSVKKVIVVPDSEEETEKYFTNIQPQFNVDRNGDKEKVNLMLEEAYFLQTAIKCLKIYHENHILDSKTSWKLFSESDCCFEIRYIVYYHFRSKNWVVKPGLKFGGDFLLYKEGPPFYHASYVVVIKDSTENDSEVKDTTALIGLQRMCETAAKELLLCQVLRPQGEIDPDDLSNIVIKEVLLKRWISSQERQENT